MIVDIGGGSTEAAVISLGGVVVHKSARVAGNKIEEAIAVFVKKQYNLIIGERMAETIKITIGDAIPSERKTQNSNPKINNPTEQEQGSSSGHSVLSSDFMEVRGRDTVTGLPSMVTLQRSEITTAIMPVLLHIVGAIKSVLEDTPPELAADIIDKGIVMAGGTSLLNNLDKLVTQMTGVPAHVADDPLLCVVRGTGVAIENIELYRRSVTKR